MVGRSGSTHRINYLQIILCLLHNLVREEEYRIKNAEVRAISQTPRGLGLLNAARCLPRDSQWTTGEDARFTLNRDLLISDYCILLPILYSGF